MSQLAPPNVRAMLDAVVPGHALMQIERLEGGLRNAMFAVRVEGIAERLVLRIYAHDRTLCQKEIDLHALVHRTVRIPEMLHARPDGVEGGQPFVLSRFVPGITFRELRRRGEERALADAATSVGSTLTAIGAHGFTKSGWLGPGPTPGSSLLEGADPCPRFIDRCLASAQSMGRVDSKLRDAVSGFVWSHAAALAALDEASRLVHCDFGSGNILVHEQKGRWGVAAILDWEFAVSASPLIDVGHFLRYDHARALVEPHFIAAFESGGGHLPSDWSVLSRALDLTALAELVTREDLPADVLQEVLGLMGSSIVPR